MATCTTCGRTVSGDGQFCPSCGSYLGWDETGEHGEVTGAAAAGRTGSQRAAGPGHSAPRSGSGRPEPKVRHEPASRAEAPGEARYGVTVAAPEPVEVPPGGEVVSQARVRNTGTLVDEFDVVVEGSPRAWAEVEPGRVTLYPGDETAVRIAFRPPRDPQVLAGETPYRLTARSALHPEAVASSAGQVDVGRYDELALALVPHEARGRRGTEHRLTFTNRGNASTRADVTATDRQDALDLRLPPSVEVGPGSDRTVPVQARPRKRRWRGSECRWAFLVQARSDGGQVLTADGVSCQPPLLTRGVVLLGLAAVAAALAVVAAVVLFALRVPVPAVVGLPVEQAVARLEQAGLDAVRRVEESPVATGTVLSAEPAAGERVFRWGSVRLAVATPVIVVVPDVVGQPAEAAAQRLRQDGLEPQGVAEATDDAEPGTVVALDPAAGSEVEVGRQVLVRVAVAPPVAVPDVVGDDGNEAVQALREAGLDVAVRRQLSERAIGTVLATEPAAGSEVERGSSVQITLAAGVEVPDLVGRRLVDAREVLGQARLGSEAEGEFFDESDGTCVGEIRVGGPGDPLPRPRPTVIAVPVPCVVTAQAPDPGSQVPLATEVQLTVSAGSG